MEGRERVVLLWMAHETERVPECIALRVSAFSQGGLLCSAEKWGASAGSWRTAVYEVFR